MEKGYQDGADAQNVYEQEMNAEEMNKFAEINEDDTGDVRIVDPQTSFNELDYIKSAKTWQDLKLADHLINILISKGFKNPSKIQSSVIGLFQKGLNSDILAQAQNGSGKTLAFVIPTILTCDNYGQNPDDNKNPEKPVISPLVVILSDTKELCYQTFKVLSLLKNENVRPFALLKETGEFDPTANVILTTLGSFFFYMTKRMLSIETLKFLVFDESDKLFGQDMGKSKLPLLFKSLSVKNKDCRIGMFSATFPEDCLNMINSLDRKVIKIEIENKQDINLKNLTHFYISCGRRDKLEFINQFFNEFAKKFFDGSIIIFVNSKNFAERFCKALVVKGHKCEILTSDMSHEDRIDVMNEFRAGKTRILVTTNLIARGIDNRKVNLVINLDLPYHYAPKGEMRTLDLETYLHRVGRTGRFGDKGIAVNIVESPSDIEELSRVREEYGINMTEITMENFSDVVEKTQSNLNYNEKKRAFMEENI